MSNIPNHLKYTKTHEWLKQDNDNILIGITAHAQELLGDMVYVELPEVGRVLSAGDELGVVESVKAASDVYSPIAGTVLAVNLNVADNPAIVNQDPYGEGWLIKIKASSLEEINTLFTAEQYRQSLGEEH